MLAVTPCTDGQECGMDLIENKAHDHSDHEDNCTPFTPVIAVVSLLVMWIFYT